MLNKTLEMAIKNNYKIFADTNAFMTDISIKIFTDVAAVLHSNNKKLYVPKSVINEIQNQSKTNRGKQANRILDDYRKSDLLRIEKKFDKHYADDPIQALFLSLRLKYDLCLITNDNSKFKDGNLAQDILDLKRSRSTNNIKDIKVFSFNKNGIYEFKDRHTKKKFDRNTKYKEDKKSTFDKKTQFKFSLPKNPKLNDRQLNPKAIPVIGSFIYDNKGNKHKLLKQMGRTGGEGSVYLTNTKYICKIYKKEKVTKFREEKIKLLIQHTIKVQNVCLPEYIIYNNNKEFVGYLMPQARGSEIKTSIFIPPLLKQKFPHWNRLHLAKIALNILQKIEKLHRHNIILGDINPSNILLNSENDIYFIDTDSFQVENYPCSVGMVPYTRKIHHGERYENYLRTKDDDIFAISTLVFQLMLPGKLPYSFSGGGSEKENMKPENFPYKCYDGAGYKNAPDGQWVYIWSHLPYKLKLLFCRIFKKNEKVSLNDLIEQMKSYIYQLEQGHQTKDIFPLTYKQVDDDGNVLKDDFSEFFCKTCGNKFAIPNQTIKDFKAKGWQLPTKCDVCRKIKDPDLKKCTSCGRKFKDKYNNLCKDCRGVNIKCNSCNSLFFFSDGEKSFYDKKGISYPKKCKHCRENKKKIEKKTTSTKKNSSKKNGGFFSSFFGW